MKNKLFLVLSAFFIISAIYHLVGIFVTINDSPPWRHGLFVLINVFIAYGIYKRPSYFIYIFVLLIIQQFYSHGSDLLHLWNEQHKVDWISLLVLLYLPTVFILLILDKKKKI